MAALLVPVLVVSSLAVATIATNLTTPASAVELPPGRLVPSAANSGLTQGQFAVTHDGAATYHLKIWTPDGRGMALPHLALSYTSRAGNGLVGVGWALTGLLSIAPCPRTIAQDAVGDALHLDGTDVYCLGENRLRPIGPARDGQREYRTETESFTRIIAYLIDGVPSHFQAWGKDRLIYTFGGTAESRREAFRLRRMGGSGQLVRESTTTRRTISWNVDRVEDRNSNVMTVDYAESEGTDGDLWYSEKYPVRIRYAPDREIQFAYQLRPDRIDGFAAGVHSQISKRLSSITVSVGPEGGTREILRQYRLSYQNTSTTGQSLLHSIVECDGGAVDGVCLLPLTFQWSLGGYGIEIIPTGVPADKDLPAHVLDINGDGRQDLMFFGPGHELMIRRSTGNGLTAATPSGIPREVTDFSTPRTQIRLADIDGDSRTDAMARVETSSLVYRWKLYRSDGNRFVPHPDNIEIPDASVPDPMHLVDLDGNGAPDILTSAYTISSDGDRLPGRWRYRLNDGTDAQGRFAPEVQTSVSALIFPGGSSVTDENGDGRQELLGQEVVLTGASAFGLNQSGDFVERGLNHRVHDATGDVNGDGLPDQIDRRVTEESGPLTLSAVVNSGNGGARGRGFDLPNLPDDDAATADGDFTGDGRDDVMFFLPGAPANAFDTAHGPQLYTWRDGEFVRIPVTWPTGYFLPNESRVNSATMMDIDGNGVLDLHLESEIPVTGGIGLRTRRILKRTDAIPDRIVRFGDPAYAASVTVDYATLADRSVHTPGTCAYPTVCQVAGGLVVKQHSVATFAPDSPMDTYAHTYEKATTDLRGRGWLGFRKHTVWRPLTQEVTVTTFRESEWNPLLGAYPYAHVPYQVVTSGVDRRTGAVREFDRTVTNTPLTRIYPHLTFRVELDIQEVVERERAQGGAWSVLSRRTTEPSYDEFGNETLRESKTTGGRRTTERTVFRNLTTSWLLGLPERTEVTGYTAGDALSETRTTRVDHDARGNPTVSTVEPDKSLQKLTTTTGYGQFGEVTSVTRTDGAGRSRGETLEYDADRLHATATVTMVGAIEHRTQVQTHSGLGVPLRTVDVNGVPATMRYDGFGRPRETHRADGSFELTEYAAIFGWQSIGTTRSGGSFEGALHDQLGRVRQRQMSMFDGRRAIVTTDYNALGLVSRVSRPRVSSEVPMYTTTEYDLRGRATRVAAPDGVGTTHTYVGLRTDTTANGDSRVHRNADGDVVLTEEFDRENTGSFLATRFEYGPFGETTKRIAPDGTASSMVSDKRTRRQETVTDPNRGVTTTFYNAFGEVEEQIRAGNLTTTYTYDALGRVTEVRSPDGVARKTWDTAPHGIGRLTNARSTDQIVTEYTYDDLGRPGTTTTRIDGVAYQVRQGYDLIGRPSTVTYPEIPGAGGRLQVVHEYNQFGYLLRVKDTAADGPVFWTATGRNPAGQLVTERFGNGVTTANTYQPATGLLTLRTVNAPGPAVLATVEYLYQNRAQRNVTFRRAVVNGESDRTDIYGYDTVDRLLVWHAFSAGQPERVTSYTYDRVGNLDIEISDVVGGTRRTMDYTYGQDGAPPHALSARNGARYTYDPTGRQLTGDGRGITYTMADLPKSIIWGQGQRTDFKYDASGARVRKSDTTSTTTYMPGLFERRQSTAAGNTQVENVHHIVVNGRTVAQVIKEQATPAGAVTATRTHYLHSDLQGSTIAVTGPNGQLSGSPGFFRKLAYDPFGQRIDAVTSELVSPARRSDPHLGYTKHEHDDELGLINMKGRVYDPGQRRFHTPDPVTPEPMSSQSNRYSYVRNNPTTLTDPTGHFETCPFTSCGPTSANFLSPNRGISTLFGGDPMGWSQGNSLLKGAVIVTHFPQVAKPRLNIGGGVTTLTTPTRTVTAGDIADAAEGTATLGDFLEKLKLGGAPLKLINAIADVIVGGHIGQFRALRDLFTAENWLEGAWKGFQAATGLADLVVGMMTLAASIYTGSVTAGVALVAELVPSLVAVAEAGTWAAILVGAFALGTYLGVKFKEWTGMDPLDAVSQGLHDAYGWLADQWIGVGDAVGTAAKGIVDRLTSSPRSSANPFGAYRSMYGPDAPLPIGDVQNALQGIQGLNPGMGIRLHW